MVALDTHMNIPPASDQLTDFDRAHLVTYLRLLDADAAGADWWATATEVLHVDPKVDPKAAQRVYEAYLARARWMTNIGYRFLLA